MLQLKDCKVGQRVTFTVSGTIKQLGAITGTSAEILLDGANTSNFIQYSTEISELKVELPKPAVGDTLRRSSNDAVFKIVAVIGEYWWVTVVKGPDGNWGPEPRVYHKEALSKYIRTPVEDHP